MDNQEKTLRALRAQWIQEFWGAVPLAWHNVKAQVHKQAAEKHDITGGQFHILRMIKGGMHHPSQLAERSKISRPAVTRLVDALVDNDMVTRSPDENDRRIIRLELTGRGETMLDELFQSSHTWLNEKLQTLTDDELEAMIRGFTLLRSVFEIEDCPSEATHQRKGTPGI